MGISRKRTAAWALVIGVLVMAAAPGARAAMPGLYFSGFYMDSSLAYSTADVTASQMEAWRGDIWGEFGADVLDLEDYDFDRTDIGYSFGVGFQMSEYFAAELSYVQIGEARYSALGSIRFQGEGEQPYRSATGMKIRARGLGLTGIAIWPMGDRWSLDARGGVLWGKKKVRYEVIVEGLGYDTGSLKDDSIGFTLGAGVNWSMSPGTAIRLGYTRLQNALYDDTHASAWLFGLKYAW
jgi:opacity protein-like surface antigen